MYQPSLPELPVVLEPLRPNDPLSTALERFGNRFDSLLREAGGILLRGFSVPTIESFREFAAALGHPLLSYEFASTPRSALATGVYTSTEYPAHQHIPLHSEQAYTREWPMKIWFHCVTPASAGGETPIADNRAIYRRIPRAIRAAFEPGLVYVRNFGELDVPWQKVFNTSSRAEVETFCARARIRCEWKSNGELRTKQLCQSVEVHPRTGDRVWFNQAHVFHVSNLQPDVRESLVELLGIENVPRDVRLANGGAIPDSMLEEIRGVFASEACTFPWHVGDVLLLDNMLACHGRTPFKGTRKVVVAMAEGHGNLDTEIAAPLAVTP